MRFASLRSSDAINHTNEDNRPSDSFSLEALHFVKAKSSRVKNEKGELDRNVGQLLRVLSLTVRLSVSKGIQLVLILLSERGCRRC